jgi:hypothetical protein
VQGGTRIASSGCVVYPRRRRHVSSVVAEPARNEMVAMVVREFTDTEGVPWRVVEIAHWAERRKHERRAYEDTPPPRGAASMERRARLDRRHVAEVRAPVKPGCERGWLTFETAREKRRLAPIPSGWAALSRWKLELLCRAAQPVPSLHGRRGD